MEPRTYDRSFVRMIAAKYEDPLRAPRLLDAEIECDALWLLTSPDPELREMGLYVLSLGPPTLIGSLYSRMRGNDAALDEIAKLVQAELALLETPEDHWQSIARGLGDDAHLRETWPTVLREGIASRRQWAETMFQTLGRDETADLERRVRQVERHTLAKAYASKR